MEKGGKTVLGAVVCGNSIALIIHLLDLSLFVQLIPVYGVCGISIKAVNSSNFLHA